MKSISHPPSLIRRRFRGFNLMEVLVALGLFTIGFVAVAAIFPTGALIQRNASTDTLSRQVALNARSIAEMVSLTYDSDSSGAGDLNHASILEPPASTPPFPVKELTDSGANAVLIDKWNEDTRSYPTTYIDTGARDFYWVPMVLQTKDTASMTPDDWRVFLFILAREDNKTYSSASYPGTGSGARSSDSVPGLHWVNANRVSADTFQLLGPVPLNPGDWILAGNGNIYRVERVTAANELVVRGFIDTNWNNPWPIYYSPPPDGGTESACKQIIGPLSNGTNSKIVIETP